MPKNQNARNAAAAAVAPEVNNDNFRDAAPDASAPEAPETPAPVTDDVAPETEIQKLKREAAESAQKLKDAREKARKSKKALKAIKKDAVNYTRMTAIGDTMKEMTIAERKDAVKVCDAADKLFTEKTGKAANHKETLFNYRYAVNLLKSFDLI